MKLVLQIVLMLCPCFAWAAPVIDFPAACGVASSAGFYHVETAVSREGQQVKSIDYYAALPRACWDDVADYADDAVPDWRTSPVIVVSGDFPYHLYASGIRGKLLDAHLGEIGMLTDRIKRRFVISGESWIIKGDGRTKLSTEDRMRQYRVYLFVPGVSRDEFRRAAFAIFAPF